MGCEIYRPAGHVSERMLGHYSHIRLEAKRRALDAISDRRAEATSERDAEASYGTNNVTNSSLKPISNSQVIEKIGGADGVRTRDLLDAIEARSQLRYGPTKNPPSFPVKPGRAPNCVTAPPSS